ADEPTGNLDKQTALQVMEVLFSYIRTHNAALILATHDQEIANSCSKIYRLYDNALHEVS
ncbi:MAG: ABC transporter ATP-binding protein, partial [Helicobacter japonicus]|nr:ABC transporter ATP-binding protein [Helicobacter japonicus]